MAAESVQPKEQQIAQDLLEADAVMEDMDKQLDAFQSKDQCSWCLLFAESLEMKHHGKKKTCRACANVQQSLYRHLGSIDEALSDFTDSEQVDFFQEAGHAVNMEGGGRWKLLKAVLVDKKAKIVEREQKLGVGSDYVPLSVWQQRGWKDEDVLAFDDWMTLPSGTKAYRCHIHSKHDNVNKRTVEESLLERERECKKRRLPKAKAQGKLGAQPAVEPKNQDAWMVDTDSEAEVPKRRLGLTKLFFLLANRCLFFLAVCLL